MVKSQEDFFRELLEDFRMEAAEHHDEIVKWMLMLEKNPPATEYKSIVENTFREIHSLKGAARAVNQNSIEKLCMALENVFHQLKNNKAVLNPVLSELIMKGVDILAKLLENISSKQSSDNQEYIVQYIKMLDEHLAKSMVTENAEGKNFNHLSVNALEKSEALVTGQLTSGKTEILNHEPQSVNEPLKSDGPVLNIEQLPVNESLSNTETIRISSKKLNLLLEQAEEFITAKSILSTLVANIQKINHPESQNIKNELEVFNYSFTRMVNEMLLNIKNLILFPFSTLTGIIPKMVRDLGKASGKEIELYMSGTEIEIDRRILEGMKDPLIHLIRNAVDHGIEKPDTRIKLGKSSKAKIEITISHEPGRKVELVILDDGAGIDRGALKESALKNGIVSRESLELMNDQEVLALIFRSGVTTSPIITDISGRGLGMAIVMSKVVSLGGTIVVQSESGQWTRFEISLPLTLSTFRGILVKAAGQEYVFPTTSVERALRIKPGEIRFVESKPYLIYNGRNIAALKLTEVLRMKSAAPKPINEKYLVVLIVFLGYQKLALIVDEILGEYESTVKTLGPQLLHVVNIAGATILGNGKVVPILYVPDLIESSLKVQSELGYSDQIANSAIDNVQPQKILVAEDSITSRTLLRNILEGAGYLVQTVVNGSAAFDLIQSETFDLVVSDVEMPIMNGFELTAKIKGHPDLAYIPVILVTSLSTDYDKQRGLESGANAYIVKSNFEQSNLVETVRQLI